MKSTEGRGAHPRHMILAHLPAHRAHLPALLLQRVPEEHQRDSQLAGHYTPTKVNNTLSQKQRLEGKLNACLS